MSAHFSSRKLISGLLVAAGLLAVAQTSVAATARLKWTPPYGTPFDNLEWFGEAEVSDGGCTKTGFVVNALPPFLNGCSNKFSFLSASLSFTQKPLVAPLPGEDPVFPGPVTTVNLAPSQFGKVGAVERTSTNPDDWDKVYSGAFRAVQANIDQTLYDPDGDGEGTQAWFSLIFVGSFAQMIWFEKDPGVPVFNSLGVPLYDASFQYAQCFLMGSGDHALIKDGVEVNRCGLSDANNARGAVLQISAVPEPQAYMMALVSLGVLGAAGSVSRRRKAKR